MIRQALVKLTLVLAAGLGVSSVLAQTPPNTVQLQPAPDIPGVIAGGTMPQVVLKGLTSSDDPMWLPTRLTVDQAYWYANSLAIYERLYRGLVERRFIANILQLLN